MIVAWLGAAIDVPMVAVRAVHFAATATAAGALIFRAVVDPVLRAAAQVRPVIDARFRWLVWSSVAIAFASGVLWLLLQTSSMSGEAVTLSEVAIVIDETQFGFVSMVRSALAVFLMICLAFDRWQPARWLALASAACLMAAVAWTGHAASTPFGLGYLHLAADALHLLAAAAWTGGLMALALLLQALSGDRASATPALQLDVVRRFSCLGIVSVATLVISGIINAWILVGSFRALVVTGYGWILMLKIAVVVVMVTLAAVNRLWLTPRLAAPEDKSLHALTRNTVAEIVLGLLIFVIVGLLGTLHPAAHLVN
jgi:putative copper resistance protein D